MGRRNTATTHREEKYRHHPWGGERQPQPKGRRNTETTQGEEKYSHNPWGGEIQQQPRGNTATTEGGEIPKPHHATSGEKYGTESPVTTKVGINIVSNNTWGNENPQR